MILPVIISILTAAVIQLACWAYAVRTTNAGWVDFAWSSGMAASAVVIFLNAPRTGRSTAVCLLLFAWAARLAWHVLSDRLRGKPEDRRYQNLREHWGEKANRNFFFFFTGQSLLVGLFMLPALVVAHRSGPFPDVFDLLGLLVAAIAVGGEAVADRQLAAFRADETSKGKVCKRGLWKYSRHPNYFFEWVHWWAYVVMATGSGLWWLTLVGPVFMFIFLRYLTGIPPAERSSLQSRGDAYREYQKTTSAFFPWIPRKP